jgi:DNA topoisomerase II
MIEDRFKHLSEIEATLLRPDVYVGSIDFTDEQHYLWDKSLERLVLSDVKYVPAALKLFDEAVTNVFDNQQRDPEGTTRLEVDIDQKLGQIRVWNNGASLPVVIHKKEKVYVPQMVFGMFHAGENFNDDQKRTTGGKNGLGVKLISLFSTEFNLTCLDSERHKKYKQKWTSNMRKCEDPRIKDVSKKEESFTEISFTIDFKALTKGQMKEMDDVLFKMMHRRVLDAVGCCPKTLKVYFNGERVKFANKKVGFKAFIESHFKENISDSLIYWKSPCERWEVGIVPVEDGQYLQHSTFVNRISTIQGGSHLDYIVNRIVGFLQDIHEKKGGPKASEKSEKKEKKKNKKALNLTRAHITKHMFVFINCLVDNPSFESQSKTKLTTKPANFGGPPLDFSKLLKKAKFSKLLSYARQSAKASEFSILKKSDGKQSGRVTDVKTLEDANWAGSKKSKECCLWIVEGDSARSLAISGFTVVGQDKHGVLSLRGKILNVRDASPKQLEKNKEFIAFKKALGLKQGVTYKDASKLRYGMIRIMCDSDVDGVHLNSLVMNILATFWPDLLDVPDGFVHLFVTPLVQAISPTGKIESFNTEHAYRNWKQITPNSDRWHVKYYKGLGTWTAPQAKSMFAELSKHTVRMHCREGLEKESKHFHMVFAKEKDSTKERKKWIAAYDPKEHKIAKKKLGYTEYMDNELVQFAIASNERAIPSMLDGNKPSTRKILYCCFKRNLKQEIKVSQLSGAVSEMASYHHGEASLQMTIIKMAQAFVGSNNINWLYPSGQFGTRLKDGKDAASPRYIFTRLEHITRKVFHPDDDPLMKYLEVDGKSVEPNYYIPILPAVLINGAMGMGTGYSTDVPMFNPLDIVENIRLILKHGKGVELKKMHPFYNGYCGTISPVFESKETTEDKKSKGVVQKYLVKGRYERVSDTEIKITEIPLDISKDAYKYHLEHLVEQEKIRSFAYNHPSENTVCFTVRFDQKQFDNEKDMEKFLKLTSTLSLTNMVLFDPKGKLKKYESPEEILLEYFDVRLECYERRKRYLVQSAEEHLVQLSNKLRFIEAVAITKILDVRNKPKADIANWLFANNFSMIFPKQHPLEEKTPEENLTEEKIAALGSIKMDTSSSSSSSNKDDIQESKKREKGYNYLLSMQLWSLSQELVRRLQNEFKETEAALAHLKQKKIEQFWLDDLESFCQAYAEFSKNLQATLEPPIQKKSDQGKGKRKREEDEPSSNKRQKNF